jgi:digalactosyldiacylglycerol synthase
LVIPWLESAQDRIELYGSEWKDKTPKDQETYIRNWLAQASVVEYECHNNNHDYHSTIEIHFYPARFHKSLGSIFAMGDVCEHLKLSSSHNDENHDAICILEEPEHLNYYRASRRSHWRHIFRHVVGVIHTNYEVYAVQNSSLAAPLVGAVSAWMVRAYCDKVIQLSKTLPGYAPEKEVVQNVHGVRTPFLQRRYRRGQKIYFLGKLLWAKGLDALLHLERVYRWRTGHFFPIDVYGTGPDAEEMRQAFANTATTTTYTSSTSSKSANHHCQTPRRRNSSSSSSSSTWTTTISMCTPHPLHWRTTNNNKDGDHAVTGALSFFHNKQEQSDEPIPVQFLGPVDHLHLDTDHDDNDNRHQHCTTHDDSVTAKEQYKIFVNPSISEVLCTVTAEAIAMGKFAIIPDHPSNTFFRQCPNCLMYTTDDEFVDQLQYAISNSPIPLDDNTRRILSWEAATERFIQAAAISHRQAARLERLRVRDEKYAEWHCKLGEGRTGDVLRKVLGGGPVAEQSKYELQKQQQQQRFQQEKQSPPDVDDDYDEGSLSPLSLSSRSQNDGVVQKQ